MADAGGLRQGEGFHSARVGFCCPVNNEFYKNILGSESFFVSRSQGQGEWTVIPSLGPYFQQCNGYHWRGYQEDGKINRPSM